MTEVAVDGRTLRVVTAALVVLAAAVAMSGGDGAAPAVLPLLAGLAVAAGTAWGASSALPTLGLLVLVAVVVDRSPSLPVVVVVAALLHAVHVLVAWCAAVPVGRTVPVAVLVPSARRWLLAQALVLPVALAVASATGRPGGVPPAVASVAAATGVVLAAVLLVRVVRDRRTSLDR